jgi:hypothetical protein
MSLEKDTRKSVDKHWPSSGRTRTPFLDRSPEAQNVSTMICRRIGYTPAVNGSQLEMLSTMLRVTCFCHRS